MSFQPRLSFTYSNIGLVPLDKSNIISRHQEDLNTRIEFAGNRLSLPIIVAPMESVVGEEMVETLTELGGLAILPRSKLAEADWQLVNRLLNHFHPEFIIPSVGVTGDYLEIVGNYYELGIRNLCIDVANGFSVLVGNAVENIRRAFPGLFLITGNVASINGYKFLTEIGVDAVRVGIGGGSVCTTSIATGVGVGQASIVREIAEWKINVNQPTPYLIADGGIKNPGDIAKAIALGADLVMLGGAFAGCEETPRNVIKVGDRKYKQLAGQASMTIKGQNEYVEGADVLVPYTGSLKKIWKAYEEGFRSAMSYMNCKTVEELRFLEDCYFVQLTDAAKAERGVHANG